MVSRHLYPFLFKTYAVPQRVLEGFDACIIPINNPQFPRSEILGEARTAIRNQFTPRLAFPADPPLSS